MSDDPRQAKTMGEAAQNADGTWNGLRGLSWLSEVLNPGKGVSAEEVKAIAERVIAERKARAAAIDKL